MQANGDYFTQLPNNIKYRCLAACYIWETVLPSTSCCWSSFGGHKAFFIVKEMHCGIRAEMLSQLCVRADALLCFCRLDLRLSLTNSCRVMVKICRCMLIVVEGLNNVSSPFFLLETSSSSAAKCWRVVDYICMLSSTPPPNS